MIKYRGLWVGLEAAWNVEGAVATYLCAAATYLMDYLKIRLNSASVEVEVEVEAELGNKYTLVLYPASPKPIF